MERKKILVFLIVLLCVISLYFVILFGFNINTNKENIEISEINDIQENIIAEENLQINENDIEVSNNIQSTEILSENSSNIEISSNNSDTKQSQIVNNTTVTTNNNSITNNKETNSSSQNSKKTTATTQETTTQKNSSSKTETVSTPIDTTQITAESSTTTQPSTTTTTSQSKENSNIETFKVNNTVIEKMKSIINNNPSASMKQFGYDIIVDSSIVNKVTGFTYTEIRVKNAIVNSFGTIRIYARDYYVGDELRWTESFIL